MANELENLLRLNRTPAMPRGSNRLARYVEPAMTAGSTMLAEIPAYAAGMAELNQTGLPSEGVRRAEEVSERLTYNPRTMEGQAGLQSLTNGVMKVMDALGVDEAVNYLNNTIVPNLQRTFGEEGAREIGSSVMMALPFVRKVTRLPGGLGPREDYGLVWLDETKYKIPRLPMDQASRMQRAEDLGFDLNNPYFHASKQDIDEMKPGYDDGLVFVTPDPEFANNWLGKGKFQERQGGTGSIEELKKQKTILRAEHNKVMESLSEADRERYYDEVAWPQTRQLIREIDEADSVIYPLLSKTKKPFRPDQDYKVFEELYSKEYLDAGFSPADGLPTFRDALKDGSYLLYERKEVVDFLKSKGYDSMFLKESSGSGNKYTTLGVFDAKDLRSKNAEFDPEKIESSNILSSILNQRFGNVA